METTGRTDPSGRLPQTAEVAVVGAGPVGLMLAGELRLGGADVVVLERLAAPTGESRASQLGPRSMELFLQRGLVDALGPPSNETGGHFGGIPLDVGGLGGAMPGNWKVPQFRTEEVLHTWAVGLGAAVHRGAEVLALREEDDSVTLDVAGAEGVSRLRARYVVGCDGGDSTVRRLVAIPFPGSDARREMLRADVSGIEVAPRRFERLERGVVAAATRSDGVTRVMVHEYGRAPVRRSAPPAFTEIADAWTRVTGEDLSDGTLLWADAFDDTCRQVTEYRRGRVLLAGDAARTHMPIGGQSLNTGLQDAVNLGWKLAACVQERTSQELLDTYHLERHPVGVRVLANVQTQATLLFDGEEAAPARGLFTELMSIPEASTHLASLVSGLDIRYPGVVVPSEDLVGQRLVPCAEAADGTAVQLPEGEGALLVAGDGADRTRWEAEARPWADRVRRLSPEESGALLPDHVRAVLVRPDGHVAWTSTSTESLSDVLPRWFGPSSRTPTRRCRSGAPRAPHRRGMEGRQ